MAESTQSEDLKTGEENHGEAGVLGGNMSKISPSKTERGLDLENIKVHLPPENIEITCNSEESAGEKKQHSSRPVDNVPNTEEERRVVRRRRIGVVKANDTTQAQRIEAKVLSKKFGEAMLHEKPSIFNKKL